MKELKHWGGAILVFVLLWAGLTVWKHTSAAPALQQQGYEKVPCDRGFARWTRAISTDSVEYRLLAPLGIKDLSVHVPKWQVNACPCAKIDALGRNLTFSWREGAEILSATYHDR